MDDIDFESWQMIAALRFLNFAQRLMAQKGVKLEYSFEKLGSGKNEIQG